VGQVRNPSPEPHVDTALPATGGQHLRFSYDPTVYDYIQAATVAHGPLPITPTTTTLDIAFRGEFSYALQMWGRSTTDTRRSDNWFLNFETDGTIQYGASIQGEWKAGDYRRLVICDDTLNGLTEYYYDGQRIGWRSHTVPPEPYGRVDQIVLSGLIGECDQPIDFDNVSIEAGLVGLCNRSLACGNAILENGEACDGAADAACPGACQVDCTCPSPVCGNNDLEAGEQCDGTADAACPGACLPPGHAAECTCAGVVIIDFEAAEGYGPGSIDGQAGWTANTFCSAPAANVGQPCAQNRDCDSDPDANCGSGTSDGVCTVVSSITVESANPGSGAQHLRVARDPTFPSTTTIIEARSANVGPFPPGSSTTEVDICTSPPSPTSTTTT